MDGACGVGGEGMSLYLNFSFAGGLGLGLVWDTCGQSGRSTAGAQVHLGAKVPLWPPGMVFRAGVPICSCWRSASKLTGNLGCLSRLCSEASAVLPAQEPVSTLLIAVLLGGPPTGEAACVFQLRTQTWRSHVTCHLLW